MQEEGHSLHHHILSRKKKEKKKERKSLRGLFSENNFFANVEVLFLSFLVPRNFQRLCFAIFVFLGLSVVPNSAKNPANFSSSKGCSKAKRHIL